MCSLPHASSSPATPATSAPCAECGAFDAHDLGHVRLCVSCYAARGACCGLEPREGDCAAQPIVRAG